MVDMLYIFEVENKYILFYEDITDEWLNRSDTSIKRVEEAKYVIKNGKRYYVGDRNKIIHKNREIENAIWYVDIMGGKLQYLPTIVEDGGISCADYRYYLPNGRTWYYLDEKETNGKGKNVFYHALECKDKQAEIFLIDCTNSHFTDKEIYERINLVFKSAETRFVKIIIVKREDTLFGVFKRRIN